MLRYTPLVRKLFFFSLLFLLASGCTPPKKSDMLPPSAPAVFTYRSDRFGVEFTLPSSWRVSEESQNRPLTGLDILVGTGNPNDHEGIRVDALGPRVSIVRRIATLDKKIVRSVENISIGNEQGKIVHTTSGYDYLFVVHGDNLFEFQTNGALLERGILTSIAFLSSSSSSH